MNYFDKIPIISYGGRIAKNIVTKAQLSESTRSNKFNFYPYSMGSERSDTLSNLYYDNPGYSWLIWLTNNIVDPYYQMPLSDEEFNAFIASKYGTVQIAQRKIKAWRNNWFSDDTRLTPGQYDTLSFDHKKYYDPVLNNYLHVSEYKRKSDSTLINNNAIIELELSPGFIVGEEIAVGSSYAIIAAVSGSYVTIEKVIGSFPIGATVVGKTSGQTAEVLSSVVLSTSVVYNQASFWTPVTFYQFEYDLNEGRKQLYLLDNRLKGQADLELKRVMEQ